MFKYQVQTLFNSIKKHILEDDEANNHLVDLRSQSADEFHQESCFFNDVKKKEDKGISPFSWDKTRLEKIINMVTWVLFIFSSHLGI